MTRMAGLAAGVAFALSSAPVAAQKSDPPLSVVQAFAAAENAGEANAAEASFTDDAVIVTTRGTELKGKDGVRRWVEGVIKEKLHITVPPDARVEGNKVTWASQSSSGFLQQLGVAPTEVDSSMTLAGSKIKFWNNWYPAASVQRIGQACRAKPVLIFGKPCADFVNAISAYTERVDASWTQSSSKADVSNEDAENFMQIHEVEITFHKAATYKDLNLMLSLFANDATINAGGKTYAGKDQIRAYWQAAGPFQPQNQWVAYTPAFRIKYDVQGNNAHLYFECLYVDKAANKIAAHTNSDDTLIRVNGRWLIKDMKAAIVPEL